MTCPALLRFKKVVYFGLTPQAVSFVTSTSMGHRVQVHVPAAILNAFFSWNRAAGSTGPTAALASTFASPLALGANSTKAGASLASFEELIKTYLGSAHYDTDAVVNGLDYSSTSIDTRDGVTMSGAGENRDECVYNLLTDSGVDASGNPKSDSHYSASDMVLCHMLNSCFGKSAWDTTDIFNIDDSFGMLSDAELAAAIAASFASVDGQAQVSSMFAHLIGTETLRYAGVPSVNSALYGDEPAASDLSGNWGLVAGDVFEIPLKLVFRAPVSSSDVDGNVVPSSITGEAADFQYAPPSSAVAGHVPAAPANLMNIRLQLLVV